MMIGSKAKWAKYAERDERNDLFEGPLSEHCPAIAWNLKNSGFTTDAAMRPLPKLDVTPRFVQGSLMKQDLQPNARITAYGPLSLDELRDFSERYERYHGLRSAYRIETGGKMRFILLLAGSMGGMTGIDGGQSPVIRLWTEPADEVENKQPTVSLPKTTTVTSVTPRRKRNAPLHATPN